MTDFRDAKPGFPAPAVYSVNGMTGFVTIATGGGGVTSLNTLVGDLNLVAGTNITITPSGGDTLTIDAASGSSSPLTTKGDVWGYSSTDARVPVGSNGKLLQADSAQTLGVGYSTRNIDAGSNKITNVTNPTAASQDAATAAYVDTADALKADKSLSVTATQGVKRTSGTDLSTAAQFTLDVPGLTLKAVPVGADQIPILDVAGSTHKKINISDLPTAIGGGGVFFAAETPTGTIDGVNTVFTLSHTPANEIGLFLGPAKVVVTNHYTRSTSTITYVAGYQPRVGETHFAYYAY